MAIFYLKTKHISHSDNRNAVSAAAYRAAAKLRFHLQEKTYDYTRKSGVVHTEIVLPAGVKADWARDREKLWNAAEEKDKRKNSRTAREVLVAIPHELNEEQRLQLCRELAQQLSDQYQVAVDLAIHDPTTEQVQKIDEDTDPHPPNYHAHLLLTTRVITEDGLAEKSIFERDEKWLKKNGHPSNPQQVQNLRITWEDLANLHLAKAGYDVRVDHRSHADRGSNIKPTRHMGPAATAMERKGHKMFKQRLTDEEKKHNERVINTDPKEILDLVTAEYSVFTYRDIARTVHRYVDDRDFQQVFRKVLNSPDLIQLQPEAVDASGEKIPARFSTLEMVGIECSMVNNAKTLNRIKHSVPEALVDKAIAVQNKKLAENGGKLTKQQCDAIKHMTMSSRMTAVIGRAGAGKSTMLDAARIAWEEKGYRVMGVALAGKAAAELKKSSGIESRTLASFEYSLREGHDKLTKKDVLVVDEAGMLDSRKVARIAYYVEKTGAKVVLVGDSDQLQPIGAGAAFRGIVSEIGAVQLDEIRRQEKDWQKSATSCFASGRTQEALKEYGRHGKIKFSDTELNVFLDIAKDYIKDIKQNETGSRLALAHRRKDVKKLNAAIRTGLKLEGKLPMADEKNEIIYQTNEGARAFSVGDRVVLLDNNKDLGVRNGMLGTIQKIGKGAIRVTLDDSGRKVTLTEENYQSVEYGYATTIHKSQGATLDRTFVLASSTLDRNLTYVSMSRHRFDTKLYASKEDFRSLDDLSDTLAGDRTKETTLEYLKSFSDHRGMEYKFSWETGQFSNRKSGIPKSSKFDRAIDFFALAWEEILWFNNYKLEKEKIPFSRLWRSKSILEKLKPGVFRILGFLAIRPKSIKDPVMDLSGQERVDAIKEAIKQEEQKMQQKKSDHESGYKTEFNAGKPENDSRKRRKQEKTDEPNYSYTPRF